MKNKIEKIIKLDTLPLGGFDGISEKTMLISPDLLPSIIKNETISHGLKGFTYLSTGYYLPKTGTSNHNHKNIDIVTIILSGKVLHSGFNTDTTINEYQAHVQRAGKGIQHMETNVSNENAKFIQMWFNSPSLGLEPSYKNIDIKENTITTLLGTKDDTSYNNEMTCKFASLKKDAVFSQDGDCIVFVLKGDITCGKETITEGSLINIHNLDLKANKDIEIVLVH